MNAPLYRVLRSVNSAAFGGGREVGSIHDALVFLGIDQIRQRASVWALAGGHDRRSEAMTMTLLRARHCELIGRRAAGGETGAAIRGALLGEPGPARSVLDAVIAYEQRSWDAADAAATAAGIPAAILPGAYADAVRWSHHLATHSAAA
jgi:c-di-GMP-related signal transduction protein